MNEHVGPQWATPKALAARNCDAYSEAGIRWLIFNSKRNGLDPHIRRIGRKVPVSVPGFQAWIESQK
jgi:hypothetical protein